MNRLDEKVALVTGAASGLGRAQAERFAAAGASVVVADRDQAAAEMVAQKISDRGQRAIAVTVDVTDQQNFNDAVARTVETFGRVDILSNTAGAFDGFLQVLDMDRTLWDRVVNVNLTSLYITSSAVLPFMIANGKGVILNIASAAGLRGGGGGAAYTATKHAVVGFTRQLSAAYGSQGIRVNAIAPGLIDTPMVADFANTPATRESLAAQPGGRIGRPEDVANAALFLVSDEADFIHAVTLPVDGGMVETFGPRVSGE